MKPRGWAAAGHQEESGHRVSRRGCGRVAADTEPPTRDMSPECQLERRPCRGPRLRAEREAAVVWGRREFKVKRQVVREASHRRDEMHLWHLRGKGPPPPRQSEGQVQRPRDQPMLCSTGRTLTWGDTARLVF